MLGCYANPKPIPENTTDAIKDSTVVLYYDSSFNPKDYSSISTYYHMGTGIGKPAFLKYNINTINIKEPSFLILSNNTQNPFFINPGDSICISGTAKMPIFTIRSSFERNAELNIINEIVKETGNIHYAYTPISYLVKTASITEFRNNEWLINEKLNSRQKLLDEFLKTNKINATTSVLIKIRR